MAGVVLKQAVIMLILIGTGAGCFSLRLLSKETVSQLSSLVLKVVNPIVILLAYQRELDQTLVENLGWTFLLTVLSYVVSFIIVFLAIPEKKDRDTLVERFSCIYSNCGFMGIPLVEAMFGYEGVFYLTAYLTCFNALVWSHGVMRMSGQKSLKSLVRIAYSPAIIAIVLGMILFFAQITLPLLLTETLEMIGGLNTPLAMLVAGATIAQTKLPEVLRKPRIFYISFLKLIVLPLAVILLFRLLPASQTVEMTVAAAVAAPSAAICTMMCLTYKRNASYASEIFGVTTLLAAATMPAMMMVYEFVNALGV